MAAGRSMDVARSQAMFDQAMARIAGRFRRMEPRATARAFILGMLSSFERKNNASVRMSVCAGAVDASAQTFSPDERRRLRTTGGVHSWFRPAAERRYQEIRECRRRNRTRLRVDGDRSQGDG